MFVRGKKKGEEGKRPSVDSRRWPSAQSALAQLGPLKVGREDSASYSSSLTRPSRAFCEAEKRGGERGEKGGGRGKEFALFFVFCVWVGWAGGGEGKTFLSLPPLLPTSSSGPPRKGRKEGKEGRGGGEKRLDLCSLDFLAAGDDPVLHPIRPGRKSR